jgi:ABC-type methionine transport system permease subunit
MNFTALATSTPVNELWPLVWPAFLQTLQMVGAVLVIALAVGTPLALLLHNTSPKGLYPRPTVHNVASVIVNFARSLPFLILMAAMIPITRAVAGTSIGVAGAIVPLSIGAIPYYARLMEATLREVPPAMIEVGRAAGGSRLQTMLKVQLPEAVPGLISNLTIAIVNVIEYTAIAGAIGAGGIGYLALSYGYNRFDGNVMLACVVILVAFVQVTQFAGDRFSRAASRL